MKELYEVKSYTGIGYSPVIDYESWRVAVLNYIDELDAENIDHMQKHNDTDEVFVLLKGDCILYIGHYEDKLTDIEAINMEQGKLYNIKRGTFHTHTLNQEAMVLIIENQDTCDDNSPKIPLDDIQKTTVIALRDKLWQL